MKFKKFLAAFMAAAMVVTGSGFSNLAGIGIESVYAADAVTVVDSNNETGGSVKGSLKGNTYTISGNLKSKEGEYSLKVTFPGNIEKVDSTAVEDTKIGNVSVDGKVATITVGSDAKGRQYTSNSIKVGDTTYTVDYKDVKFDITGSEIIIPANTLNSTYVSLPTGATKYPVYLDSEGAVIADTEGKSLKEAKEVEGAADKIKDGKVIQGEWTLGSTTKPGVQVFSADGATTIKDTNYTITGYANDDRAGEASVTIKANEDSIYTGELTAHYYVVTDKLTKDSIVWDALEQLTFGQYVGATHNHMYGGKQVVNTVSLADENVASALLAKLNSTANPSYDFGEYSIVEADKVSSKKYSGYNAKVRFTFKSTANIDNTDGLLKDAQGYYMEKDYSDIVVNKGVIYVSKSATSEPYKTLSIQEPREDLTNKYTDLGHMEDQNAVIATNMTTAAKDSFVDGKHAKFGVNAQDIIDYLSAANVDNATGTFTEKGEYVNYALAISGANGVIDEKDYNEVLAAGDYTITVTATPRDDIADYNVQLYSADKVKVPSLTSTMTVTVNKLSLKDAIVKLTGDNNEGNFDGYKSPSAGIYMYSVGDTQRLTASSAITKDNFKAGKNYDGYFVPTFKWTKTYDGKTTTLDENGDKITTDALKVGETKYEVTFSVDVREDASWKNLSKVEQEAITALKNEGVKKDITLTASNLKKEGSPTNVGPFTYSTYDATLANDRTLSTDVNVTAAKRAGYTSFSYEVYYGEGTANVVYTLNGTKVPTEASGVIKASVEFPTKKAANTYNYYFKVTATDSKGNKDVYYSVPQQVVVEKKPLRLDVSGIGLSTDETVVYGTTNEQIAAQLKYNGTTDPEYKEDEALVAKYLVLKPNINDTVNKEGPDCPRYPKAGEYVNTDKKTATTPGENALHFVINLDNSNYAYVDKSGDPISNVYIGSITVQKSAIDLIVQPQGYWESEAEDVVNDTTYPESFRSIAGSGGSVDAQTERTKYFDAKENAKLFTFGAKGLVANDTAAAFITDIKTYLNMRARGSYKLYKASDLKVDGTPKNGTKNVGDLTATSITENLKIVLDPDAVSAIKTGDTLKNYKINSVKPADYTFYDKTVAKYDYPGYDRAAVVVEEFGLTSSTAETLKVGQTANITTKGADASALTYDSDNKAVATVADGVITAVGAGEAKVSVSNGYKTFYVTVTVIDASAELAVTSDKKVTIEEGKTSTITIVGATKVTFTSKDTAVATVSETGVITGVKEGTTTIEVSDGTKTETVEVTVKHVYTDTEIEKLKKDVEDAQKALEDAQKDATTTEAELEKAKSDLENAQNALKTAEANADTKVADAEKKASDAEKKATDAEKKATDAENKAAAAETKATEAQKKAAAEKKAAAAAETKATEAQKKAAAAEKKAAAAAKLKKGAQFIASKNTFKVTNASKKTVTFTGTISKAKTVKIGNTVKVNGVSYKVTAIAASAFKGNTTVKKVTIGKNVTTIGKNAFNGCKKLKTITIKSKSIKKVGAKAFKGTASKAKVKVPSAKVSAYKKLFKKAGLSSKAKVTK